MEQHKIKGENEENKILQVCNFKYLTEMMNNEGPSIAQIMETFLVQISGALNDINKAVASANYPAVENLAHAIMSTACVMGISSLDSLLREMEDLGAAKINIEKIIKLNQELNAICNKAIVEVEKEKLKYIYKTSSGI